MQTVAVVDDANSALNTTREYLESASFSVSLFDDPEGVEEEISRLGPDLVLLGVTLPKRNGYAILRSLKRHTATRHLPVVLMSQPSDIFNVEWGLQQGAAGYITKPFSRQGLLTQVARFLHPALPAASVG